MDFSFFFEVAKKQEINVYGFFFLLEVTKKQETNVKGLTTLKKKKIDANLLIEDT